jgi:hypothetical protein
MTQTIHKAFYIKAKCACGQLFETTWHRESSTGFKHRQCAKCRKANKPQGTITVVYAEPIEEEDEIVEIAQSH